MLISFLSSLLYRPMRHAMSPAADHDTHADAENRRGYYRIRFPEAARPRMLVDSPGAVRLVCEVLECSERGVRLLSPTRGLRAVGTQVSGTICFASGAEARVAGSVIRAQGDEVALVLAREGIPLGVVLDEQRRLRSLDAAPE